MFKWIVMALAGASASLTKEQLMNDDIRAGFIEGYKMAQVGDMNQCIADLEAIVSDAETALADVKKGDPASLLASLKAFEDIVTKVESLKSDCTQ